MTSEGRGGCDDKEGSKLFKLERRKDDAKLEDDLEDRSGSALGVVRRSWSSCLRCSNLGAPTKKHPLLVYLPAGD